MTTNINLEISIGLFHGLSGILNLQSIMTTSVGINVTAPRIFGLWDSAIQFWDPYPFSP